jgi:hypothetical protein
MSCPYTTPEESMEQGCGVTALPELVTTTAAPTTTAVPTTTVVTTTTAQVIETDVSLPPAVVTRELAITGGGIDIAFGGALALIAGAVIVRAQRRLAR